MSHFVDFVDSLVSLACKMWSRSFWYRLKDLWVMKGDEEKDVFRKVSIANGRVLCFQSRRHSG